MSEWISITEREPKKGEWIFLIYPSRVREFRGHSMPDMDAIDTGCYIGNRKALFDEDFEPDEVALWSPVPLGFAAASKKYEESK